jgi:hypothetical protein
MTSPRDLLRQRSAPAPIAVPMPTEVRTGGLLLFQLLIRTPDWVGDRSSASIIQWSFRLGDDQILALFAFLRMVGGVAAPAAAQPPGAPSLPTEKDRLDALHEETSKITGMTAEPAIDAALRALKIGNLLGVFVEEGRTPYTVRVMIGVKPDGARYGSESELNTQVNLLYRYADFHENRSDPRHAQFPPAGTNKETATIYLQASAALQKLRSFWQKGEDRTETRAMMLAQYDIVSQIAPNRSPFSS